MQGVPGDHEHLQKKIQALNQGFANSCQLAKGLVNDVADAFDVKHKDNTSLLGMVKGLGDVFETRSSAGGADPIAQVRDNVPAADKTQIEGNLVWQALKRKGAAGWFLAGEDTLLEAMMSVTGSVIVGPPEDAPDGQGPNHRITYLPGNLLKAARSPERYPRPRGRRRARQCLAASPAHVPVRTGGWTDRPQRERLSRAVGQ